MTRKQRGVQHEPARKFRVADSHSAQPVRWPGLHGVRVLAVRTPLAPCSHARGGGRAHAQAGARERLHLAPELLPERTKAVHLRAPASAAASLRVQLSWQRAHDSRPA